MENFVRLTAPTGKVDFIVKLLVVLLICGALNHFRHILMSGYPGEKSFWVSTVDAGFTALPMSTVALMLIGHLNSLQRRLYQQATRDPLTRLPNRRWFMNNTPTEFAPNQSLMIVDLDYFKRVNDQFGHDVGDRCLNQMADHLREHLGSRFKFARIGGEEFAAYADGLSKPDLEEVARHISAGFAFQPVPDKTCQITASIGVAICRENAARTQMLRAADDAVYLAKSQGRARHMFFDGQSERVQRDAQSLSA